MAFKINISEKSGKTFHLEAEAESLVGKELRGKISGAEISPDLSGYEFEITGASDKAGFPALEGIDGILLKKVLLTYGKGMNKKPRREGKRKISKNRPKGLRLRKTVRGMVLSPEIVQVNLKVLKEGAKTLDSIFPDQGQGKVKENRASKRKQKALEKKAEEAKPAEAPKPEETKEEAKQEEKTE